MESEATYLFLVQLCCFCVKCLKECWHDNDNVDCHANIQHSFEPFMCLVIDRFIKQHAGLAVSCWREYSRAFTFSVWYGIKFGLKKRKKKQK